MKLLATIGLLTWIVFVASADDAENQMTFFQVLQGEWEVQQTTIFLSEGEHQVSEQTHFHYSIAQDNETLDMALVGRYYQKDMETGDFTEDMELVVDFTDPNTGVFRTQSNYEFTTKPLFKFDFHSYPNGVQLSHGDWQGGMGALYQFQIPDPNTFTITLFPKPSSDGDSKPSNEEEIDDEEFISSRSRAKEPNPCTKKGGCDDEIEIILYLGKKQVVTPEKSIVQRYGWVIIGGMIILNIYFQKKQRQPSHAPPATSKTK